MSTTRTISEQWEAYQKNIITYLKTSRNIISQHNSRVEEEVNKRNTLDAISDAVKILPTLSEIKSGLLVYINRFAKSLKYSNQLTQAKDHLKNICDRLIQINKIIAHGYLQLGHAHHSQKDKKNKYLDKSNEYAQCSWNLYQENKDRLESGYDPSLKNFVELVKNHSKNNDIKFSSQQVALATELSIDGEVSQKILEKIDRAIINGMGLRELEESFKLLVEQSNYFIENTIKPSDFEIDLEAIKQHKTEIQKRLLSYKNTINSNLIELPQYQQAVAHLLGFARHLQMISSSPAVVGEITLRIELLNDANDCQVYGQHLTEMNQKFKAEFITIAEDIRIKLEALKLEAAVVATKSNQSIATLPDSQLSIETPISNITLEAQPQEVNELENNVLKVAEKLDIEMSRLESVNVDTQPSSEMHDSIQSHTNIIKALAVAGVAKNSQKTSTRGILNEHNYEIQDHLRQKQAEQIIFKMPGAGSTSLFRARRDRLQRSLSNESFNAPETECLRELNRIVYGRRTK